MAKLQPASKARRFWRTTLLLTGGVLLLVGTVSAVGGAATRSFSLIYFAPIIAAVPIGALAVLGGAALYRSRARRRRIVVVLGLGILAAVVAGLLAFVLSPA